MTISPPAWWLPHSASLLTLVSVVTMQWDRLWLIRQIPHTKLGQFESFSSKIWNIFYRKIFCLLNLVLKIKYLGAASSGELSGAELRPRGGRKSSLCFRRGPPARPRPRHQAAGGLKAARHKAAREREGRDPACVMSGRACVRARRVRVRNENVPLFLKVYLSWRKMQTFKLILLS